MMYKLAPPTLLATVCLTFCPLLYGQNSPDAIQQKLVSEYSLTQPTGDETDIATAGAVLTLKKGHILMTPVSSHNLFQNTYKNGQIGQNAFGMVDRWRRSVPGQTSSTRTFVPGEKMWVTKIEVKEDGIVFDLFSDPFSDVRYKATLKFWFPKGATPTVDDADKLVAQVFSAQPPDNNGNQQAQNSGPAQGAQQQPPAAPASAAAPAQQTAPPAPIAPPPPPTDQPPATVNVGASPDQVTAALGQPQKQIKLGTKMIWIYNDVKVTFVKDKVTDVQ